MLFIVRDIKNEKFGRLTALFPLDDKLNVNTIWHCSCDCGNEIGYDVPYYRLVSGNTKSCGCLRKETMSQYNKINKKKYNTYDLSGDFGVGWTSNTNEEFYFDLEDYDKIKNYCWYVHNIKGYKALETAIYEDGQSTSYRFSWFITGKYNDHINRNPLDNRKENLREYEIVDYNAQNHNLRKDNTSGVTGVNWNKRENVWVARINKNNERFVVYRGTNYMDAIRARLIAEREFYGEYAPQRHLFREYGIA